MDIDNIPSFPGIYKILNTKNNKYYIGSSVNLKNRLSSHKRALEDNSHKNKRLQRDWNKYGSNNFKIEILMYCDRNILYENDLFYFEQRAIDHHNSNNRKYGYNQANTNQKITENKLNNKQTNSTRKKSNKRKLFFNKKRKE